jgi:hypothetical protein
MAGTLKDLDCRPTKIGGVDEHVHVFCSLSSKDIAFSDLIGRLKVAPFQGGSPYITSPRAEAPDFAKRLD